MVSGNFDDITHSDPFLTGTFKKHFQSVFNLIWSKHQDPMLLFNMIKGIGDIPIKAFLFQSHELGGFLTDFKKQVIITVLKSSPRGELLGSIPPLGEIFLVDQIQDHLKGNAVAIDLKEGVLIF